MRLSVIRNRFGVAIPKWVFMWGNVVKIATTLNQTQHLTMGEIRKSNQVIAPKGELLASKRSSSYLPVFKPNPTFHADRKIANENQVL